MVVQVALIGAVGVVLAAIINAVNKYVELSFLRQKESYLEKVKEVNRIQDLVLLAIEQSSSAGINAKNLKIDEYLRSNMNKIRSIARLTLNDRPKAVNVLTELKDDFHIALGITPSFKSKYFSIAMERLVRFSPWLTLEAPITIELNTILFTAEENYALIEKDVAKRYEKLDEIIRKMDINVSEEKLLELIGKAFATLVTPTISSKDLKKIDSEELDQLIRLELKRSSLYLRFYKKIWLAKNAQKLKSAKTDPQ